MTPHLVAVSVGALRDESLMKFFKVAMDRVESGSGVRVLIITVHTKCLEQGGRCLEDSAKGREEKGQEPKAKVVALGQGAYELLLDIQTAQPAAAPDLVKLTLKLAAAQIDVPATLAVRQEVPFFWGEPETNGSLLLTEKSGGKTRLTNIRIQQVGVTGGVDETTAAELKFDSPPAEIGPSGSAKVPVTLSSAFPLGKTTGKLAVHSPQLGQPMTVNFEVAARLPRWVIVACIVAGLIFSYVVRVWSVKRIEVNEARVKAAAAADTLRREMADRPDEEFVGRVKPHRDKLLGITPRTTAKEIQLLVDGTSKTLGDAVQDFDQRRTEAHDLFDSLKRLTEADWQLPEQLVTPLAESRPGVEEAGRKLEGKNIVAAKKALDAEAADLGQKLGQSASAWRPQTKSFVDGLAGLAPLLPASASAGLTQEVMAVNMLLDAVAVTNDGAALSQVESMLGALRHAQLKIRELVARARLLLKSSKVIIAKAQASTLAPPHPDKIAGLIERFDRFQATLVAWAEQPEAGAEKMPSALNGLKAAWWQAMLAQIEGDQTAHKRVADLFDAERFVDATEAAVLAVPKGETLLGDEAAGAAPFVDGVGELFEALTGTAGQAAAGTTIFRTVRERSGAPQLDTLRALSTRELYLLRLGRFIVAAAIITYGGWLMFADKVGTPLDLFAIFVWAFGMNFSVDTVLDGQEIKKIVKVEKT